MKHGKTVVCLFALVGLLSVGRFTNAGLAPDAPPVVQFGLAVASDFVTIKPFPADGMQGPNIRNLVYVRAHATDDKGIKTLTIQGPSSSGTMGMSATKSCWIGLGTDTRNRQNGDKMIFTVIATDTGGNESDVSVELTLKK